MDLSRPERRTKDQMSLKVKETKAKKERPVAARAINEKIDASKSYAYKIEAEGGSCHHPPSASIKNYSNSESVYHSS